MQFLTFQPAWLHFQSSVAIETPIKNFYMFKLIIKLMSDLIRPVNLKYQPREANLPQCVELIRLEYSLVCLLMSKYKKRQFLNVYSKPAPFSQDCVRVRIQPITQLFRPLKRPSFLFAMCKSHFRTFSSESNAPSVNQLVLTCVSK